MYRVLYDGDSTQMQSAEEHLYLEPGGDVDEGDEHDEDVSVQDDDDSVVVDDVGTDSEDENVVSDRSSERSVQIGNSVKVGDNTWVRVQEMGSDVRIEEDDVVAPPIFGLKNLEVTDDVEAIDFFLLMLPVPLEKMLEVVKYRAAEVNDKYKDRWYKEHVVGFLLVLLGSAQFKRGTNLWSRKMVGLIPPLDFGRYITEDRYKRVQRYLSRGPEGCDDLLAEDPWAQVRWLVDGFNEVRRRELTPGPSLNPDESMFAWKGKSGVGGLPHMSFVKRKPEPLGLENKNTCDGTSGVMLFMEMQEGKIRMARKKWLDKYSATTATTLRLVEGCNIRDGKKRTVHCDSWFMSKATRDALSAEFNMHSIGSVKTAHRNFPAEDLRWTLDGTPRGTHVVFKCQGEDTWAIGWSDIHYKLYLATCGESTPGKPAGKMRQRADGRNYSIDVPRPKVLEEYAVKMGSVDLHNRYRQGLLGLHKVIKTTTWQARIQNELFATCTIDAFLLSQYFLPKWKNQSYLDLDESKLFAWLGDLLASLIKMLEENDNVVRADAIVRQELVCQQVPIGRKRQKTGAGAGAMRPIQQRCRYCSLGGERAPQSLNRCEVWGISNHISLQHSHRYLYV